VTPWSSSREAEPASNADHPKAVRSWAATASASSGEGYFVRGQKKPRSPSLRLTEQRIDQLGWEVDQGLVVRLRHQQRVAGKQRARVEERERRVGVVDDVGRLRSGDDRAEDAAHPGGP
jgi:hypothetical protein